jgi:hypothetical protein
MDLQKLLQLEINEINNSRVGKKTDKQLHLFLKARPIRQYSLQGELIAEYPSKSYTEKKLGLQPGGLDRGFTSKKLNSYGNFRHTWSVNDEKYFVD